MRPSGPRPVQLVDIAGCAPGCPKIQQDDFAPVIRESERGTVDCLQREVWREFGAGFELWSDHWASLHERDQQDDEADGDDEKQEESSVNHSTQFVARAVGYPLYTQSVPRLSAMYNTLMLVNPILCNSL